MCVFVCACKRENESPLSASTCTSPTRIQTHTHAHTRTHTRTHAHTHAHTHTRTHAHTRAQMHRHPPPIQVKGSPQQVTTFDDLDDEMMIQIARSVPLGCTNLSQLNHRAKRLQLSGYQLMLDWVKYENITHIERWVDAFLLHVIGKMHISLLFCNSMCVVWEFLFSPANKVCCLIPFLAHLLSCSGILARVGRF